MCGEHRLHRWLQIAYVGSSPRVRRTQLFKLKPCFPKRFISACAENTFSKSKDIAVPTVHLRVCGEHVLVILSFRPSTGSSPRVRRTRHSSLAHVYCMRFISACAENTLKRFLQIVVSSVHLRVCGEHFSAFDTIKMINGSSPRVRRTPLKQHRET